MSQAKILVSGGSGYVGRFIVEAFLAEGYEVVVAGRNAPAHGFFSKATGFRPLCLGEEPRHDLFDGIDCFVHAAFDHVPGKYRGGEGDDPDAFVCRNLSGTTRLFDLAKASQVGCVALLSTRAVYGTQIPGSVLTEDTSPHPDTLYGQVKRGAEEHLQSLSDVGFRPLSLRVTGVYGPAGTGQQHKWRAMFQDYADGRVIAPRVATEVHGEDVARALVLLVRTGESGTFNVSDCVVDRHDLLRVVAETTGCTHPLPDPADSATLNIMNTDKLHARGWQPGGWLLLERTVREMVSSRSSDTDSGP